MSDEMVTALREDLHSIAMALVVGFGYTTKLDYGCCQNPDTPMWTVRYAVY